MLRPLLYERSAAAMAGYQEITFKGEGASYDPRAHHGPTAFALGSVPSGFKSANDDVTVVQRGGVVVDVIGGEILQRSTALVRAGGTLVTIAGPPTIQPENGRAIFFVVEADRSQLAELAQRLRDGRLTSNVGAVRPLAEAPAAFGPDAARVSGKTIIRITEGW